MLKQLALSAVAAMVFAAAATAQNYTLAPNFGVYELSAGFTPDPAETTIVAGGPIDAEGVGCSGFVSEAPDVRLMWSGGEITLGARSDADTTIVVNSPEGEWYCADDVNGFDPAVTVSGSGQYDIWVGVYDGGTAEAVVYATEF